MEHFYQWLEQNGFKATRGDVHWMNSGWWFPELPEDLSEPEVPGRWVWVQKDRGSLAAFVTWVSREGRDSVFVEDLAKAKKVVGEALARWMMESDEELEGGSLSGVTSSCDLGAHERCTDEDCECACHPFKKCSCGRSYTEEEWKRLPWIGEQKIEEGGTDEPAEIWVARNCVCGSTLMSSREK